ncbi:MAG: class I SAM-dependent methyltransferase [Patescibacteria group bacterium]|nr:class I SAM-dependent methyltransferase [Patescibacteria group bacterium]
MENPKKTIRLGGAQAADEERLYLRDATFALPTGEQVEVTRSNVVGLDMGDIFARHQGRYYQVGLFCRPGQRVLDFPCGSGYASEVLAPFHVRYEGLDIDVPTLGYAQTVYGNEMAKYAYGDLKNPQVETGVYDTIGCIEGLEHIEMEYQDPLIAALRAGLKPGGILVVSSPENLSGTSGQSPDNKWHVGELTKEDFVSLLRRHFPADNVELVTHSAVLSTGKLSNCFYGICHK